MVRLFIAALSLFALSSLLSAAVGSTLSPAIDATQALKDQGYRLLSEPDKLAPLIDKLESLAKSDGKLGLDPFIQFLKTESKWIKHEISPEQSLDIYLQLAKRAEAAADKRLLAYLYFSINRHYFYQSQPVMALEYLFKAKTLNDDIVLDNRLKQRILVVEGILLMNKRLFDKAIERFQQALALPLSKSLKRLTQLNLILAYYHRGSFETSYRLLKDTEDGAADAGLDELLWFDSFLMRISVKLGKLDEAAALLSTIDDVAQDNLESETKAYIVCSKSQYFLFNKQFDKAMTDAKRCFEGYSSQSYFGRTFSYDFLIDALVATGRWQEAYQYKAEQYELLDKWMSAEYDDYFKSIEDAVMLEQRENELASAKTAERDAVQKQQLAQQLLLAERQKLLIRNGLLAITILIVALGMTLYRRNQLQSRNRLQLQINSELKRLDKLKDSFLANTSHELRTPLNGIIGLSESLLKEPRQLDDREHLSKMLQLIASSGHRLSNLVNDILDFSSLKEDKLKLRKTGVSIKPIVDQIMSLSRYTLDDKPLTLANRMPDKLPLVWADKHRLHQILFNLVGNAIKYSSAGEIVVGAEINDEQMRIRISNPGKSLTPEMVERLFKPFETMENGANVEPSSGIGLAVSKQLAMYMGGDIEFDGQTKDVNCFVIKLPLLQEKLLAEDESGCLETCQGGLCKPCVAMLVDSGSAMVESVEHLCDEHPPTVEMMVSPPLLEITESAQPTHATILIVDDDLVNRLVIKNFLAGRGYRVLEAADGDTARKYLDNETLHLVLLDVMLPDSDGYELCRYIRRSHDACKMAVIFLTAKNQPADLKLGFASGGNDYLTKPINGDELLLRINTQLQLLNIHKRLTLEYERLLREHHQELDDPDILTQSRSMQTVLQQVAQVSPLTTHVLLSGESGSGKEVVAHAVHRKSRRADKPFIVVNCAALPNTLIESELFGHERGAFTGAAKRKLGAFELAHQGTLFLDEVGELPLEQQAKLLRAIQEKQIQRLGGSQVIDVDIRLICATHRDLPEMVAQKQFREDLYYRLNVYPIAIPPLRERKEDIELLTHHFVSQIATELNIPVDTIPDTALSRLKGYRWPGNVRELRNICERAVIASQNGTLQVGDWFDSVVASTKQKVAPLAEYEKQYILQVLKQIDYRVYGEGGAAELLGIKPTTLMSKLKKMDIDLRTLKSEAII